MLVAGLALILLLVVPPVLGILNAVLFQSASGEDLAQYGFRGSHVARTTVLWAVSGGFVATLVGWLPGRRLSSMPSGWLLGFTVIPLALPAALLFDAWWLQVGPDSFFGAWAARTGQVSLLREAVLALGFVCWAWPISALCIAARGRSGSSRLLAHVDGLGVASRFILALREDRGGLFLGWLLSSACIAGNTVCFDLAQVSTWGFELRALDARGASASTVFLAGLPAMGIAIVVVLIAGYVFRVGRTSDEHRHRLETGRGVIVGVAIIVSVPLALLLMRGLSALDLAQLRAIHGPAIFNTLILGILCGGISAGIAMGVCSARCVGGRIAQLAMVLTGVCAVMALAPATLIAVGIESAWNRPVLEVIYGSFIILPLGVCVRIAVFAAGIGLVAGSRSELRRVHIDAPASLRSFLQALGPLLSRVAIVSAVVGATLGMGEIAMVARIQPPGIPLVTTALLNAMHYQYVDTVIPAVLVVVLSAVVVAVLVPRLMRRSFALPLLACVVIFPFGCRPSTDTVNPQPVDFKTHFGQAGTIPGRFDYPRSLAIDGAREELYVVDKTARIQRFTLSGTYLGEWRMPRWENGKPTGVSVADDGKIYVADTHYHRVAVFDRNGQEVASFGEYGLEPGQFIYPTDIAFGPEGILFVSEYGGNDRIQVFDSDGEFLREFGTRGEGRDQLSRPQGLAWDDKGQELYIADAVNHRIVVTDANGAVQRLLGSPGHAAGELSYPYDVSILEDGSVLVVEFGNNRIQHLDATSGECLGVWGGTGVQEGRLRYPWSIDSSDGIIAVLDSGNNRVLIGDAP